MFITTLGSPTLVDDVVELLDRPHVGPRDVPDVDVVADAGAVGGRVVDAGDGEGVLLTEGGAHQLAEDVRGLLGVDAGRQVGVGADRVEVAQDHRAQVGRRRDVLEDLLHHPLGAGVRRRRVEGVVLAHLEALGRGGVQRGGRGEQHAVLAEALEGVEELQRLGDVVAVVLVGQLDRLGHDDARRHVDRGVEVGVLLDDPGQQGAVGDVALVEDPVADEDPRARQQRVEDDRRVARLLERLGRRRADVAGSAGHENLHAGQGIR